MFLCLKYISNPIKWLNTFKTLFNNTCPIRAIYWWLHVFFYFFRDLKASTTLLRFWLKKKKKKQAGVTYVTVKLRQSNWYSWALLNVRDVWLARWKICSSTLPVSNWCWWKLQWFTYTLFEAYLHNTFISVAYIFYKAIMAELSKAYVTSL